MKINKLITKYHKICEDIAYEFNKVYFDGEADTDNLGDDYDGVWEVGDYYFTLSDMALALELRMSRESLFDWHDQWTDPSYKKPRINMRNWRELGKDLKYCKKCVQMTNHKGGKCLKCKIKKAI
jgi:hypothetical protein